MNKKAKIFLAGHTGLVGSAVKRKLEKDGYCNLVTCSYPEIDLTRQKEVETFFSKVRPEYVFLCAAKVGGILANCTYPADFIYNNIMIAANVINASYHYGVRKLLNLGSSCIYPRLAQQPIKERYFLTGELEPTNEPYAIAKIAAIKMCRYYNEQYNTNNISVMPTNLYGPGDNFDLATSHVLPAMIRRFHESKKEAIPHITLWGTGSPKREFMHVDDLADAVVFLMSNYDKESIGEFVNVGTGKDLTIKDLSEMIKHIVGYEGETKWDSSKPDGAPRKLLDVSRIEGLGWKAKIGLEEGIKATYEWYMKKKA